MAEILVLQIRRKTLSNPKKVNATIWMIYKSGLNILGSIHYFINWTKTGLMQKQKVPKHSRI